MASERMSRFAMRVKVLRLFALIQLLAMMASTVKALLTTRQIPVNAMRSNFLGIPGQTISSIVPWSRGRCYNWLHSKNLTECMKAIVYLFGCICENLSWMLRPEVVFLLTNVEVRCRYCKFHLVCSAYWVTLFCRNKERRRRLVVKRQPCTWVSSERLHCTLWLGSLLMINFFSWIYWKFVSYDVYT